MTHETFIEPSFCSEEQEHGFHLAPFTHAVSLCKVPDSLYNVICEMREICICNFPAQDVVTLPDRCLYGCVVKDRSHIASRGMRRVTSSDTRLLTSSGRTNHKTPLRTFVKLAPVYLNAPMLIGLSDSNINTASYVCKQTNFFFHWTGSAIGGYSQPVSLIAAGIHKCRVTQPISSLR